MEIASKYRGELMDIPGAYMFHVNIPGVSAVDRGQPPSITVGVNVSRYNEIQNIPRVIEGCPVRVERGGGICTTQLVVIGARVVDDQTGAAIEGAYWRSETADGKTMAALNEGWSMRELHTTQLPAYKIADDNELGELVDEPGPIPISVQVRKTDYRPIERVIELTSDGCHIVHGSGLDTLLRLVKTSAEPRTIVEAALNQPPRTGALPGTQRPARGYTATLLKDGRVLLAGGCTSLQPIPGRSREV